MLEQIFRLLCEEKATLRNLLTLQILDLIRREVVVD